MSADFWSRRRARVAEEEAAEAAARARSEDAAREAELEEKTDEELLEQFGLPEPETLSKGDDFSAFMAREIPERLRRRALRRLWRSDPVLACVDGLNDYDDDYTGGGVATGTLKTAYRVGEGLARRLTEPREPDAAEEPPVPAAAEEPDVAVAAAPEETDTPDEAPESAEPPAPRRRMRFAFDDSSNSGQNG
ncbi:DUF3306 domain-containing protein [Tranquillimonas rosea]|uniref:DUF3306 domain-containing protein n=1 Tax=Tranquillimonas rosea TaxID=641238 RepID=UPI003BAB7C48